MNDPGVRLALRAELGSRMLHQVFTVHGLAAMQAVTERSVFEASQCTPGLVVLGLTDFEERSASQLV